MGKNRRLKSKQVMMMSAGSNPVFANLFMEKYSSGLRGLFAKQVGCKSCEGSNPSFSAVKWKM